MASRYPVCQVGMYYAEHEPSPAFANLVAAFWHFRTDADAPSVEHTIPPDGCLSLLVTLTAPALVIGPRTTPSVVTVQGGYRGWGVRFRPGMAACGLPVSPQAVRDVVVIFSAPDAAWATWTDDVVATMRTVSNEQAAVRAWETLLARRPALDAAPDPAVRLAAAVFIATRGTAEVAAVAALVRLSPRQLLRRFRAAVGLTPKEFASARRVRSSLVGALAPTVDWAGLAVESGFSDQAHLAREVSRLFGRSPTAARTHLAAIEHGHLVDL